MTDETDWYSPTLMVARIQVAAGGVKGVTGATGPTGHVGPTGA
jgi:hypothetical protein